MTAEQSAPRKTTQLQELRPSSWASIAQDADRELERWVERRRRLRSGEGASGAGRETREET